MDSALAELVRADGTVAASVPLRYRSGSYHGDLGRPGGGTYALRARLVVSGWNVLVAGPTIVRRGAPAQAAVGAE